MRQAAQPDSGQARKTASVPARLQPQKKIGVTAGGLAQLQTMINGSPQVQSHAQLRSDAQQSHRVQGLIGLATEINQGSPLQPDSAMNNPEVKRSSAPAIPVNGKTGEVAQRVLFYKGATYKNKQELAKNGEAFSAFLKAPVGEKEKYLSDPVKVYDLGDNFKLVDAPVEKSAAEKRNEAGAKKTTEVHLKVNTEDYPEDATLYAPINKAILVINDGPIRFVGTSGLLGCVEVIIEYHAERESGYVVAHVSSDVEDDEAEIRRQLNLMLGALSEELQTEISWAEFNDKNGKARLTLVRNNPHNNEPRLFVNMRNILAESGASMAIVNSPSVTLEITPGGGLYYINQGNPKMDFRSKSEFE
jgi:hypothetical protein